MDNPKKPAAHVIGRYEFERAFARDETHPLGLDRDLERLNAEVADWRADKTFCPVKLCRHPRWSRNGLCQMHAAVALHYRQVYGKVRTR